ncbi:hypothetical protein ScPMuIL_006423 [Solemya velum]
MRNNCVLQILTVVAALVDISIASTKLGNVEGVFSTKFDGYYFEGELIEINCTINRTERETSSQLYFTQNDHRIPDNFTDILNRYTLMLSKPAVFSSEPRICEFRIRCAVDRHDDSNREWYISDGEVCVLVEKKPHKIQKQNIQWVVHDWKYMTADLDLGENYKNMNNIEVTWEYSRDSGSFFDEVPLCEIWAMCPHGNKTSCLWKEDDDKNSFNMLNHCIQVNVTNAKRHITVSSDIIVMDPMKYVKPAPVDDLTVNISRKCSMVAEWKHNALHRSKKFIRTLSMLNGTQIYNVTNGKKRTKICKLLPYTKYVFSVTTIPAPPYSGYPSETVSHTFTTLEGVPERGAQLFLGGFQELPSPNDTCRLIHFHHQDLEPQEKNGIILNNRLTITNPSGDVLQEQEFENQSQPVCLPKDNLFYTVALNTRTIVGYSNKPSKIKIGPKSQVSGRFHVEVNKTSTNYQVKFVLDSKKSLHIPGAYWYYAYYCLEHFHDCRGGFRAFAIPANKSEYIVEDLKHPPNMYKFGLSVQQEDEGETISSGIKWANCIYEENGRIRKAPKNFRQENINGDKIYVGWDKYLCPESSAYVKWYSVLYCLTEDKKNCTGQQKEVKTEDSEQTSLVIEDRELPVGRNVMLRVRAYADKDVSPDSVIITSLRSGASDSSELPTYMYVGSIIGSLVLVLALLTFIYKCRKRIKKDDQLTKIVDLPLPEDELSRTMGTHTYTEVQELGQDPDPRMPVIDDNISEHGQEEPLLNQENICMEIQEPGQDPGSRVQDEEPLLNHRNIFMEIQEPGQDPGPRVQDEEPLLNHREPDEHQQIAMQGNSGSAEQRDIEGYKSAGEVASYNQLTSTNNLVKQSDNPDLLHPKVGNIKLDNGLPVPSASNAVQTMLALNPAIEQGAYLPREDLVQSTNSETDKQKESSTAVVNGESKSTQLVVPSRIDDSEQSVDDYFHLGAMQGNSEPGSTNQLDEQKSIETHKSTDDVASYKQQTSANNLVKQSDNPDLLPKVGYIKLDNGLPVPFASNAVQTKLVPNPAIEQDAHVLREDLAQSTNSETDKQKESSTAVVNGESKSTQFVVPAHIDDSEQSVEDYFHLGAMQGNSEPASHIQLDEQKSIETHKSTDDVASYKQQTSANNLVKQSDNPDLLPKVGYIKLDNGLPVPFASNAVQTKLVPNPAIEQDAHVLREDLAQSTNSETDKQKESSTAVVNGESKSTQFVVPAHIDDSEQSVEDYFHLGAMQGNSEPASHIQLDEQKSIETHKSTDDVAPYKQQTSANNLVKQSDNPDLLHPKVGNIKLDNGPPVPSASNAVQTMLALNPAIEQGAYLPREDLVQSTNSETDKQKESSTAVVNGESKSTQLVVPSRIDDSEQSVEDYFHLGAMQGNSEPGSTNQLDEQKSIETHKSTDDVAPYKQQTSANNLVKQSDNTDLLLPKVGYIKLDNGLPVPFASNAVQTKLVPNPAIEQDAHVLREDLAQSTNSETDKQKESSTAVVNGESKSTQFVGPARIDDSEQSVEDYFHLGAMQGNSEPGSTNQLAEQKSIETHKSTDDVASYNQQTSANNLVKQSDNTDLLLPKVGYIKLDNGLPVPFASNAVQTKLVPNPAIEQDAHVLREDLAQSTNSETDKQKKSCSAIVNGESKSTQLVVPSRIDDSEQSVEDYFTQAAMQGNSEPGSTNQLDEQKSIETHKSTDDVASYNQQTSANNPVQLPENFVQSIHSTESAQLVVPAHSDKSKQSVNDYSTQNVREGGIMTGYLPHPPSVGGYIQDLPSAQSVPENLPHAQSLVIPKTTKIQKDLPKSDNEYVKNNAQCADDSVAQVLREREAGYSVFDVEGGDTSTEEENLQNNQNFVQVLREREDGYSVFDVEGGDTSTEEENLQNNQNLYSINSLTSGQEARTSIESGYILKMPPVVVREPSTSPDNIMKEIDDSVSSEEVT